MPSEVRFCTAADGVRLAYAVSGRGPAVVKAGHWLTNIDHDWTSPVWRHWLEYLTSRATLVRYDERGCGLSDRQYPALSLDTWVGDLDAVVAAAGVERCTLLGLCQGGPIAIAYAARHPERVERLVLYGTYARGKNHRNPSSDARAQAQALIALTRSGWGQANPAYRRLFTTLFIPGGSDKQVAWFDELQQQSCSGEHAARAREVKFDIDVTAAAASIDVPTLVLHARDDALVPFEEGRNLAALMPGAQFIALESANHILLEDEPAWSEFRAAVDAFLPAPPATSGDARRQKLRTLTTRELELLELVAAGHDNEVIAQHLHLSVRTVERHLSNIYVKLDLSGRAARAAAAAVYAYGAAAASA